MLFYLVLLALKLGQLEAEWFQHLLQRRPNRDLAGPDGGYQHSRRGVLG